jgi:hypothetical protein
MGILQLTLAQLKEDLAELEDFDFIFVEIFVGCLGDAIR